MSCNAVHRRINASEERLSRVAGLLREAAARRAECPSNDVLAARAGFHSVGAASEAVSRLERRGIIQVRRFAMARVITIVATGEQTAAKSGAAHWSARGIKRRMPSKSTPEVASGVGADHAHRLPVPEHQRVDRDACPRCGVRGDIGCAHAPAPLRRICSL